MADKKLSALTALTGASTATGDLFYVVDISTGASFSITRDELHAAVVSGFFSDQATAEGGTDNTKVMTPLRTSQAISALGSAVTFIASTDISSVATLEFTGFDATRYDGYTFILQHVKPATDATILYYRTSTDGGSTYETTGYGYVIDSRESGGTLQSLGSASANNLLITGSGATHGVGNASTEHGVSGELKIHGPHLAFHGNITGQVVYDNAAGGFERAEFGGRRGSSADVNAIQFRFSSGNLASGTISMYGWKNS